MSFLFALLIAAFGFSGCGGNGVDTTPDLGNFIDPAAGPPVPDLARTCVSTCKADSDCANSCPAVPSGASCCDIPSGTCYSSLQLVCPAPVDMSFTPSY